MLEGVTLGDTLKLAVTVLDMEALGVIVEVGVVVTVALADCEGVTVLEGVTLGLVELLGVVLALWEAVTLVDGVTDGLRLGDPVMVGVNEGEGVGLTVAGMHTGNDPDQDPSVDEQVRVVEAGMKPAPQP